jgi:hypothetical protein
VVEPKRRGGSWLNQWEKQLLDRIEFSSYITYNDTEMIKLEPGMTYILDFSGIDSSLRDMLVALFINYIQRIKQGKHPTWQFQLAFDELQATARGNVNTSSSSTSTATARALGKVAMEGREQGICCIFTFQTIRGLVGDVRSAIEQCNYAFLFSGTDHDVNYFVNNIIGDAAKDVEVKALFGANSEENVGKALYGNRDNGNYYAVKIVPPDGWLSK